MKELFNYFKQENIYEAIIFSTAGLWLIEETIFKSMNGRTFFSNIFERIFHDLMAGTGTVLLILSVMIIVDMFR